MTGNLPAFDIAYTAHRYHFQQGISSEYQLLRRRHQTRLKSSSSSSTQRRQLPEKNPNATNRRHNSNNSNNNKHLRNSSKATALPFRTHQRPLSRLRNSLSCRLVWTA